MKGYDVPIYINITYPFRHMRSIRHRDIINPNHRLGIPVGSIKGSLKFHQAGRIKRYFSILAQ